MHIGFVTPEYASNQKPEGGLANYLKKTGYSLVRRGYRVSIFVLSNRDNSWVDNGVQIFEINKKNPPELYKKLPYLQIFFPALYVIQNSNRIKQEIWKIHKKEPFSIIQVPSYSALGFSLVRNLKVPIVCRISSYSPSYRSAYGRKTSIKERLLDWLELYQVKNADAVFAPSRFTSDLYKKKHGIDIDIIRTPIDANISEHEYDLRFYQHHFENKKYLLYFGQLSKIKGVDLFAYIIPKIFEQHPELNIVFIGRDDGMPDGNKVFDFISSNCKQYKDRIHYSASLPKTSLFPIISHSIGVIMPSRVDNYPNACLEAQSLGIPVIGTYNSSLEEMIIDGETGYLVENESISGFVESINKLLNLSLEERKMMENKIFNHIDTIRNEDRIGQLVRYYEKIINASDNN